ncbi:MAG: hypothetical protein WC465_02610 [Patescibacteria group bacterium]
MMIIKDKGYYLSELQIDVSVLSFMTAVTVFLAGLLLTRFDSFSDSIKVPISFLIISTLGFLFSSLIIANSCESVAKNKFKKVEKHILYGYAISEYIGIYLFVLSIPLTVNVITSDLYLRIVTLCATIGGMALYQFMGFSILERHFPKSYRLFSFLFLLFGVILYLSQVYSWYFMIVAIVFILFISTVTFLAPRKDIL